MFSETELMVCIVGWVVLSSLLGMVRETSRTDLDIRCRFVSAFKLKKWSFICGAINRRVQESIPF